MSFVTVSMNPTQASNTMRREIDRLLQDVGAVRTAPVHNGSLRGATAFIPAANGFEDANGFTMEFEVPGFAPEQLDVTAQEGSLIVRGNKPPMEVGEGVRALFVERLAGSFERTIRLPKTADVANITASYAHGVLTVNVAKLATVAPRKVAINVGNVVSDANGAVANSAVAK